MGQLWRHGPFRFRHVGRVAPDPRWSTPSHGHAFHELICVVRGRIFARGETRTVTGTVGDVLLYPAGAMHGEWTEPDAPLESLFIGFDGDLPAARDITLVRDTRGRISEMVRWMHDDASEGRPADRHGRDALLGAVLAEFESGRLGRDEAWIERVRHHVRTHLDGPLDLGTLAGVAGLSRFHFVRSFRAATGQTPMAAVRAMRLQHARQLILGTALPLKGIAAMSGLGDEHSLSRVFRKELGHPPGALRHVRRGNAGEGARHVASSPGN